MTTTKPDYSLVEGVLTALDAALWKSAQIVDILFASFVDSRLRSSLKLPTFQEVALLKFDYTLLLLWPPGSTQISPEQDHK